MQFRPGFELVSPCPFPRMITITPLAPPNYIRFVSKCFEPYFVWKEGTTYLFANSQMFSTISINDLLFYFSSIPIK